VIALATADVAAQRSLDPEASPGANQPGREQQPGQGAEVHTGTASGLTLDARLQNLLADHQYARLATELDRLPPDQAQLYRGVLDNRTNHLNASIEILEPLIDQITASGDTAKEKLLRKTLAEDYLRLGDLGKAATAYAALESRLGAKLSEDEQDEIELPVKLLPLAKENPPMTVDPCDPFTTQVAVDPLGLTDVPVFVDATPKSWMLDPTAPFNLINRATARVVGLKVSDEAATIHTLTGKPIQVHMAVIPRITVGGVLTFHDMTVFVFEDADYSFPDAHYQVEGVLGYPALSALGSITVTQNSTIQVQPAKASHESQSGDQSAGTPFYLDGDQVIVALGRTADAGASGDDRMFAVDAGGQQTYLTSRYFDEHAAEFNKQQVTEFSIPGGSPQPAYVAETVPLRVGGTEAELHFVRVLTEPVGSAALDDVYGVLGVDALEQFRSYTFDYRTMRFSVVPEP
jgi:hypothetical protein